VKLTIRLYCAITTRSELFNSARTAKWSQRAFADGDRREISRAIWKEVRNKDLRCQSYEKRKATQTLVLLNLE